DADGDRPDSGEGLRPVRPVDASAVFRRVHGGLVRHKTFADARKNAIDFAGEREDGAQENVGEVRQGGEGTGASADPAGGGAGSSGRVVSREQVRVIS